MTSAIEQQLVGWPLPASDVARIESIRSRVATFFNAGMSDARSITTLVRLKSFFSATVLPTRRIFGHEDHEGTKITKKNSFHVYEVLLRVVFGSSCFRSCIYC